jgi:hypothetical protein
MASELGNTCKSHATIAAISSLAQMTNDQSIRAAFSGSEPGAPQESLLQTWRLLQGRSNRGLMPCATVACRPDDDGDSGSPRYVTPLVKPGFRRPRRPRPGQPDGFVRR